jgi:hypothetical protein
MSDELTLLSLKVSRLAKQMFFDVISGYFNKSVNDEFLKCINEYKHLKKKTIESEKEEFDIRNDVSKIFRNTRQFSLKNYKDLLDDFES